MISDTLYSESQITLMVPDTDEAVRFYTTTLGLRLKTRYNNEFAVVEAPGLTIGLHPLPTAQAPQAHSMSIGLWRRVARSFDGTIVGAWRSVHRRDPRRSADPYRLLRGSWRHTTLPLRTERMALAPGDPALFRE